MRKVIYTEWVRGVITTEWHDWYKAGGIVQAGSEHIPEPKKYVDETNCNVEKEGLFHGFFPVSMENIDGSFGNSTDALIEHEDGTIVNVEPSLIRFIDKPETEQLAEVTKS